MESDVGVVFEKSEAINQRKGTAVKQLFTMLLNFGFAPMSH
jgi:hypothetical protein